MQRRTRLGKAKQWRDAALSRPGHDGQRPGLPDQYRSSTFRRAWKWHSVTTANLCTPGTNVHFADTLFTPHCISSKSKTYDGDQWVRAELLVLGDSLIRHMVEGETVLEYTKPEIGGGAVSNFDPKMKVDGTTLTEGFISLQSESHPVEFRKVELLELKGCKYPKAKNYKSYYVKPENSNCQY